LPVNVLFAMQELSKCFRPGTDASTAREREGGREREREREREKEGGMEGERERESVCV